MLRHGVEFAESVCERDAHDVGAAQRHHLTPVTLDDRIDRSEATRLETEATLVRFAEPSVWLGIAALAAAVLVGLAWRTRQ